MTSTNNAHEPNPEPRLLAAAFERRCRATRNSAIVEAFAEAAAVIGANAANETVKEQWARPLIKKAEERLGTATKSRSRRTLALAECALDNGLDARSAAALARHARPGRAKAETLTRITLHAINNGSPTRDLIEATGQCLAHTGCDPKSTLAHTMATARALATTALANNGNLWAAARHACDIGPAPRRRAALATIAATPFASSAGAVLGRRPGWINNPETIDKYAVAQIWIALAIEPESDEVDVEATVDQAWTELATAAAHGTEIADCVLDALDACVATTWKHRFQPGLRRIDIIAPNTIRAHSIYPNEIEIDTANDHALEAAALTTSHGSTSSQSGHSSPTSPVSTRFAR